MKPPVLVGVPLLAAGLLGLTACAVGYGATSLERGFLQPPPEVRPWVYWFWLNGNITREGITADLEAMQRVGIGGVLLMEVDQGVPRGPVGFLSPQWRELFQHTAAEAQRLGLEVNVNNDAGWNGSGGPWIKPELSMQEMVWSETDVTGPKHFQAVLPQPKTMAGFYRDIAALAFPSPGSYRIEDIQDKALYRIRPVGLPTQKELASEMVIDRERIVDLSSGMDKNGRLVWDVPAGRWTILRLGHTSTGVQNAPAPESGRGLECDKLSREGVEANFNGMMAKLIADVGGAAGKSLVATHVDSWENGSQNWTARMREEFQKRRGYDLLSYLPTMTGRVVGSLETSERFLWDLRKTVSEMVVENYAGHLRELAHQHGLRLTIEAYGSPCDHVPYGGQCDEPMGEFWVGGTALETCRGMASTGHVYGKRIIGAEAFTAGNEERWLEDPATIKSLGDRAFCEGINRFVFHRYALQPWLDRRPGMAMGPWGTHYERTQTWWELTPAWHRYLARCQFLLRQGRFVADICYLQSEGAPQGFHGHSRQGYNWDECSPEVVMNRMTVADGRLVLPDGMDYRVLVLPDGQAMTPQLVRRIRELVEAGATVIGSRVSHSPSLSGHPKCDEEVRQVADELWGKADTPSVTEHRLGLGRVVWGTSPEKVLERTGVPPDFTGQFYLRFIHREVDGTQVYFVANPLPHAVTATATFRVQGKKPELWWPDTGRIEPAAIHDEKGGLTHLVLPLDPSGSVFVLFRNESPRGEAVESLSRDGAPVCSLSQRSPRIVVEKAIYGIPGVPQRTRDVCDAVQQKVDRGEYNIPVLEMAEGGDPEVGVVKTLVVDYAMGGEHFTVKGQDGMTVFLGSNARIVVEKAEYGLISDPKRRRDVRAKIEQIADAGQRSFPVSRLARDDDPAANIVKTLWLEYTINGQRVALRAKDHEFIYLDSPLVTAERVADLHADAEGRLWLEAWQRGNYELTTRTGKRRVEVSALPSVLAIAGPWQLRFPPACGAPESVTLERLISWSKHPDDGIKYFSGTATYQTTFTVGPEASDKQHRAWLDLGQVHAIAQVRLNGKDLGTLWKPPFRADVTEVLVPGENRLEIRVTNLWPNRMIGDEHLPEDSIRNPDGTLKEWPKWLSEGKPSPSGRYTFTTWRMWARKSPLLDSGLLGPVSIRWTAMRELAVGQ